MKRIRLVEFEDGTFGVRYGWFKFLYYDFVSVTCTGKWPKDSIYFESCKTTREKAEAIYNRMIMGERVIK